MTPERKAEIRKACEAATQGPWSFRAAKDKPSGSVISRSEDYLICSQIDRSDAKFIALARTALPELLDEVERLEKKLQSQLCTMKTVRDFIADDLPYVAQNILEATLEAADA